MIEIDKTEQSSDWSDPDLTADQINYAARDVEVLFLLAQKYHRYLDVLGLMDVFWVESRFMLALIEMEFNGLPIDLALLQTYRAEYQAAYDHYYALADQVWKNHSPQHMGVRMERPDLKIDNGSQVLALILDVTGEAKENADKQVLSELGKQHECFKAISLCRTIKKSLDKFDAIQKSARRHPSGQWVVSGGYKQFTRTNDESDDLGAGTGRTGSGSGKNGAYLAPNLQNIPVGDKLPEELQTLGLKSIRECFRVDDGCFYIHDLSAAHSRIACSLSMDELILSAYRDETIDNHAITVTRLISLLDGDEPPTTVEEVGFAKKAKESTPRQQLLVKLRNVGKNFYYSCLNDGGAFVLHRLFQSSRLPISMENCEKAVVEFFKIYQGLGKYIEDIRVLYETPPPDFPENIKTLRPRSQRSKWKQFNGKWYAAVQPGVGLHGRRVYRAVRIKKTKSGDLLAVGPKISDVLSAIWLGIEATAVKQAAAQVYEWAVYTKQEDFFLGGITHDELDAWSFKYNPEADQVLIRSMDECLGNLIKPVPPGPYTKTSLVKSWNDK